MKCLAICILLPVMALIGGGCAPAPVTAADLQPLHRELAATRAVVQRQSEAIQRLEQEMNDGLSLALCRPELRQLLDDVTRECSDAAKVVPGARAGQQKAAEMCTTNSIRPAVIAADPAHKERFLRMMSSLRHEVAYVRRGADLVMRSREERIERLAKQSLLRNTMVLVVAHAGLGEDSAAQRAAMAERYLQQYGVPADRIKRWLYAFPISVADFDRQMDRPQPGEPSELRLGVWIFRADC